MILRITAAVLTVLTLWCVGGAIVTLTLAWVNARTNGNTWFSPRQTSASRWSSSTENLPPAALVFLLWPVAIPVALMWLVVVGFARLTEKLGNKVIALAERQAKAVRE